MEETSEKKIVDAKCYDIPSNTMVALAGIGIVLAIFIMIRYTKFRGFWYGLGFVILGSMTGTAIGRIISPPKEVSCF